MIRVCHIITGLQTGGAERMLLKLLTATDRERFEPAVVSLMDRGTIGPAIEALGIPVLAVGLPRGRPTPAGLVRLIRAARGCRPEVIQGWMYHGNIAASLAAPFLPGRPAVLWNIRQSLYGLDREKPLTRAMIGLSARLSGLPRAIVYNSAASAGQHEALGFRREGRVLVPNGFECARYAPSPETREHWRREHLFGPEDRLVGLAARYHPMKDHAGFLEAAALLAGRDPRARFVLAGTGVDADNAELAGRIAALGLGGRVRLLGERADMSGFFQALDVAVLASAWGEAFPNVLGEAMASGTPCVATDVGDSAVIVGTTGRIVPPRNPATLAAAMAELLDLPPAERVRFGREARQRILEHYSLPAIAARYEQLYTEAAGPLRPHPGA